MKSPSKTSNPKGGEVITNCWCLWASAGNKSKSTNLTLKLYLETNVSNKDCQNNENN